RIHRHKLAMLDMKAWEYWCHGVREGQWSERPVEQVPLFRDAAPEMTVSRVRGLDGLVATYIPLGLGRDIMMRHARHPQGPWSQPVRAYCCPDAGGVFTYAAKAHPELSMRDGQLVITYCRN